MVLGPSGDVLILDRACSRVTQAPTTGAADGGRWHCGFLNALQDPEALVYDDASGEIYIADTSNHRVMCWQLGGATGTELITNGPATARGKLSTPTGVALSDSGAGAATLYVVEGNLHVRAFSTSRTQAIIAFKSSQCCMVTWDCPCPGGRHWQSAGQGLSLRWNWLREVLFVGIKLCFWCRLSNSPLWVSQDLQQESGGPGAEGQRLGPARQPPCMTHDDEYVWRSIRDDQLWDRSN